MKSTEMYQELFRKEILNETGFYGLLNATEELRRSRFFIETMEEYIASSETAEIKQLEVQAQALSDEAKEEFWQWNYPIHWEDIFGVRIRSAFCAQLCSQVEATLGDIAHRVQVIERCAVKVKNIKGSTLERYKLYLTAFAKFEGPETKDWREMGFVFRIRNIHIHEQGFAGRIADDKAFSEFLSSISEVSTANDFIELKAGSCLALLEITERFHNSLLKEYEAYRQRALAVEHRLLTSDATRQ